MAKKTAKVDVVPAGTADLAVADLAITTPPTGTLRVGILDAGTGKPTPAAAGVFAPAKIPDAIVATLSNALSAAVLSMSDELEKIGVDARGWEADRFDAFFRAEIPRWAELVRMTGVREQR